MRALVVASEAPPVTSGVARCIEHLADGLGARGHEIEVVSSAQIKRWMLGEFRVSSFAAHLPKIAKQLSRYDVINLHGPVPTMTDAFLAYYATRPRIERPPLVYTHHCEIDLSPVRPICGAYNLFHRGLTRVADRIVTSSESYRQLFDRRGGPEVQVVPWGVDFKRFASIPRERRRPGDPLRVLFVGQLRPYKGVGTLIDAVAGVPQVSVTIAGAGPLETQYRKRAATMGATNVSFAGRVPDGDLEQLYARHDVICLPSTTRAEAFGLVLLEGMAAGCVPVASDLPGVRDVAGPTGVLTPPGSIRDLREALLRLSSDPERLMALSHASRDRSEDMAWDGVAGRYERTFLDVVSAWRDRRALYLPAGFQSPEAAMGRLVATFGASWASLILFDPLVAHARVGWGRAGDMLRRSVPKIAQWVARTGTPLLLDETSGPEPVRPWLRRDDVGSALTVPLRCDRGTLGVLSISIAREDDRRFTTNDLRQLVGSVRT